MNLIARLIILHPGRRRVAGGAAARATPNRKSTWRSAAGSSSRCTEKWRAGDESKWKQNGKVILLVHGATWSSRCTFDPLPGYSLMDTLADDGWDVWAIDLHGYGCRPARRGRLDRGAAAAPDLDAAADYIRAAAGSSACTCSASSGARSRPPVRQSQAGKGRRGWRCSGCAGSCSTEGAAVRAGRTNAPGHGTLKPEDGDLDAEVVRRRAEVCLLHDPTSPNGALQATYAAEPVDPPKGHRPRRCFDRRARRRARVLGRPRGVLPAPAPPAHVVRGAAGARQARAPRAWPRALRTGAARLSRRPM